MIIKVKFPFQWEYGYGEYGLGTYLYLWNEAVLFIKDEKLNSEQNDERSVATDDDSSTKAGEIKTKTN